MRTLGVEHEAAIHRVAGGEQHVEEHDDEVGDAEGEAVGGVCGGPKVSALRFETGRTSTDGTESIGEPTTHNASCPDYLGSPKLTGRT